MRMGRAEEAVLEDPGPGERGGRLDVSPVLPSRLRPTGGLSLLAVAEPCTLRSAGGRVRDGLVRQAGAAGAIIAGISGLHLGQDVDLVLPRRGGLRLRARIAGIGVLGVLIDLRPADCGAEWRQALLGMTDGAFVAA
jgi:hypothetical protein